MLIKNLIKRGKIWVRENLKATIILGVLGVVGITSVLYIVTDDTDNTLIDDSQNETELVEMIDLNNFTNTNSVVKMTGEVESVNQAEIKAETQAPIKAINIDIGDEVTKGQILVVLNNADFSARVIQAEAGFDRAMTQLTQLQQGLRKEAEAVEQAEVSRARIGVNNAESTLFNSLDSAYVSLNQAVRSNLDLMYNSPTTNPDFGISISSGSATYFIGSAYDSRDYNLNSRRRQINDILEFWRAELNNKDFSRANDLSIKMINDLNFVLDLSNDIANSINDYVADNTSGQAVYTPYRQAVVSAQTTLSNALSSVRSNRSNLEAIKRSAGVAEEQYQLKLAPPTNEELSLAQSNVKQMRASLLQAQADLNKTILRSPVKGSVIAVPVRLGEYVSPGQSVALVANQEFLQITGYVSVFDSKKIKIDDLVNINNLVSGQVYKVAPGLNPTTNQVEVLVRVNNEARKNLVIGETITVEIIGNNVSTLTETQKTIILPLKAVVVETEGSYVFTLDANNKVVRQLVKTGFVSDQGISIISGLEGINSVIANTRLVSIGDRVKLK